ncbi:uncharacterized protein LOC107614902 [Arachis ipaensis]|uniref:uncharacterized protein LOC107614902 n=1 Tax=Arachis ipaensis TaxID=130454 RepID=UPI000A2B0AA4|nr:uncharacterized protein LOC107614902 [Arachis ipaensis]
MDKVFHQQIGWNMKIYVDDMVAKTTPERSHCEDLKEIFSQIRAYNMRLNPEKCAFGVQRGKFLGFMLTSRGIKANSEKCEAILNMASPKTIKEVQQLAGRVAALSRFLPVVSNRSYHFFQTISKSKKFEWTKECETAFAELKATLSSPPVLQSPETEFDIQFQSRPALKSQILADIVSELTADEHHYEKTWEIQVDGASNREGSRAGIVLREGETVMAEQSLQFNFSSSNNQAEYEALIAGIMPSNETNPQNFRRKASLFTTIAGELYRRGFSHPLLKCLNKDEANEVMNEVHEGVCGNHIEGRALAAKIIRTGYYWPTMKRDCIAKVKTCDNCQKHAAVSMKLAEVMHSETPFKLVYGSEALIPIKVGIPTLRTELYNQQHNINMRKAELDLAEEDRDMAAIK